MEPSYSVPLSVTTEVPEKKGPVIVMGLPSASRAWLTPSRKTPTASLNSESTYSGYSSEPTTYSNPIPSKPSWSSKTTSRRTASLDVPPPMRASQRGSPAPSHIVLVPSSSLGGSASSAAPEVKSAPSAMPRGPAT